jgi:hypothetical protein
MSHRIDFLAFEGGVLLLRVTDAVTRGQFVSLHQPILDQTSNALLNSSIVNSPLPRCPPSRPLFPPFLAEDVGVLV